MWIFSIATSSSSAAICIVAVSTPVPSSTLPVKTVTLPSPATETHESSCAASTTAGPIDPRVIAAAASDGVSNRGRLIPTTSAPEPLRNVRRSKPCSTACETVIAPASSVHRRRRGLDRGEDAVVGPAAAEPRGHRLLDLGLRRRRVLLQERRRGHDHPVRAVAALRRLVLRERLLERMRMLERAEALERGDGLGGRLRHCGDAGADGLVAQVDRARPALREPAPEPRSVQVQLVAQDVEERC